MGISPVSITWEVSECWNDEANRVVFEDASRELLARGLRAQETVVFLRALYDAAVSERDMDAIQCEA